MWNFVSGNKPQSGADVPVILKIGKRHKGISEKILENGKFRNFLAKIRVEEGAAVSVILKIGKRQKGHL